MKKIELNFEEAVFYMDLDRNPLYLDKLLKCGIISGSYQDADLIWHIPVAGLEKFKAASDNLHNATFDAMEGLND